MADATKTEATLANLTKILLKLKEDTSLLKSKGGNLDAISKELPPLEFAKLNASVGYSLNSLYKGRLLLCSLYEA